MDIQELINQPRESLAIELKDWIDPNTIKGKAKIVKAAVAMRNNNGGYLIIGFDNERCLPNLDEAPENVQSLFHVDEIQAIVSKHASQLFEVTLHFVERDGQEFPVIEIGSGVESPVAIKKDIMDGDNHLVKRDRVYVRTLASNNRPSTSEATWQDWDKLVRICFENREADIGRFLKRHVPELISQLEVTGAPQNSDGPRGAYKPEKVTMELLQLGSERFEEVVAERGIESPPHGSWEVAGIIDGTTPIDHVADRPFLRLIGSSNPNYTGWPVWLDSSSFRNQDSHPYTYNDCWEAIIANFGEGFFSHFDFWRIDPTGNFYLRRALQDDIGGSENAPEPLTSLDFGLAVLRSAEAIAVITHFARAMDYDLEGTSVHFEFRWSGLRGRELSSWTGRERDLSSGRISHQDVVLCPVSVPLDVPDSMIAHYTEQAVSILFRLFDGFPLANEVYEDLVKQLLSRRL